MATFFNNRARAAAAAANASSSKAAASKDVNPKLQPWVEKYRPKSLDDVAAQEHTVQVLQRTLQASNLPHMLFYGPPGTGKTSTILALAKQLYGPSLYSSRVLELNASDERGISIVREKVKDFARQQLTHPPSDKAYRDKYPCPPFKIIVLDEADSMTQDAQSALRRTMETYSKITRFCLVCNYVTRIIDPLASRCSKFRFKSLAAADASRRLNEIAKAEGVKMEAGVVDRLIAASEGDLRKAITFLQSAARLAGTEAAGTAKAAGDGEEDGMDVDGDVSTQQAGDGSGVVTARSIDEIAGTIPGQTMDELVEAIRPKGKGATYTAVARTVNDMIADGWSAGQAVSQLYNRILFDDMISNKEKNQMTLVFSEVDKRLIDGADEHLEILDLALRISGIMSARPRGS